ncbi:SHOCT domain-containing protein [Oenococcus oeni]|uniref:SHOCT domain-containing protein n=1 Tax=Oenococcus oeni TaxID=1247 RepID=UPI000A91DAB6|nr:SHOCT domain-containing protein [Oenococcus oeni]
MNINKKARDKSGKKISKHYLLSSAKKIKNNQPITNDEQYAFTAATGLTTNDYLTEESEKERTTYYIPSNGMPIKGKTKIREKENGLIYFSQYFEKDPVQTYKIVEFDWNGPQYTTRLETTGSSKNKHLVPIIKQKRTTNLHTTETKTEDGSLAKLILLDTNTKQKIVSETKLFSAQNNIISAFKIWDQDIKPIAHNSIADQIKEVKNLLDQNLITESEFSAKKKQLLGL